MPPGRELVFVHFIKKESAIPVAGKGNLLLHISEQKLIFI